MTSVQEPQTSQTFTRSELKRILEWYPALPACSQRQVERALARSLLSSATCSQPEVSQ